MFHAIYISLAHLNPSVNKYFHTFRLSNVFSTTSKKPKEIRGKCRDSNQNYKNNALKKIDTCQHVETIKLGNEIKKTIVDMEHMLDQIEIENWKNNVVLQGLKLDARDQFNLMIAMENFILQEVSSKCIQTSWKNRPHTANKSDKKD